MITDTTSDRQPAADAPMAQQLLWRMGYDAFADCRPYRDMETTWERDGWEAARNDLLRAGRRIVGMAVAA